MLGFYFYKVVKRIVNSYRNSFRGLSVEVWWLALITFINRAGTMVLPFLSLYLNKYLDFSLSQVGWIMSVFGVGSFVGSWLGGKLTDKIGFYKVMVWSLLLTGFLFIGLQYITTFLGFCIAILITMTVADTFRPAMFVSLKVYSKPENQTRSLTLIRLAINLGFSFGPFLGGLIILGLGYSGLFWVDGITCIAAILLFVIVLKQKKSPKQPSDELLENIKTSVSIYKDKPYWIFLAIVFIMGFLFFQLFTTMPLYYKDVYDLSEVQIGLLMSLNGLMIFFLEMPLIHYLEKTLFNKLRIIMWSLILFVLSFAVLINSSWLGILIISMVLITIGEMLAFPFTNSFALNRSPLGKEGKYMALYTMAFSLAHIFSSKTGMEIIDRYGFSANWLFMSFMGVISVLLSLWLIKEVRIKK